ncbi:condensation domain-containing protein [Streptomyces sp. XM4193]|uniref:condensation domain-containing protein n=1 Tax=Streptomyces sp. XM4193 TaxID=2929782 RepID=UPI001FFA2A5B|nr:condensation domain-containing protein [Streptomyces sp. XM4193]MCK1798976.1 condensation domain-containing protein [Streptomyces sp. XM4193]
MTQRHVPRSGEPRTTPRVEETRAPLMWSQEPYWYQYHLPLPVVDSAKIQFTVRVPGKGVPESAVVPAVRELMHRHEALRTVYPTGQDGIPFQSVLERFENPVPFRREGNEPEDVDAVFHALFGPPMVQSVDLPLRVGFTVENNRAKTLVLLLNHISADGVSLPVMRADLERYLGLPPSADAPPSTPERDTASLQPAALAREQHSGSWDARNGSALRHCEDVLSSAPAAQFPRFRFIAGSHAEVGSHYLRTCLHSSRLLLALQRMRRESRSSVSSALSATFSIAVAALSGNPRTVFKTNFSNRFRGFERSVGCFFQEALVSVHPRGDATIAELMAETENRTLVGARRARYSYLHFRDLKARVEARRGHSIRLGTVVNFSSRFEKELRKTAGPARPTEIEELECLWRDEYADLSLRSFPRGGEAVLDLIAHRTVVERPRIRSMLTGMEQFLIALADEPELARATVAEVVERFALPVAQYPEGWVHIDHSWVNTAKLATLIRTVEGVEAASVGVEERPTGERVLIARLVGRPSAEPEVRHRVLGALREEVDLVCPHEFSWLDGSSPLPASAAAAEQPTTTESRTSASAASAADRRGADSRTTGRRAADRALAEAVSAAIAGAPVDLDLSYAQQGGTAVLAPAVVQRLALRGFSGPNPDDLLGPWPLRAVADLCVAHREDRDR